ncbi:MAG: metallophosphoesterase [Conexivisphaerales archaeon]
MQEATIKLGKGLLIVSPWPVVYLEQDKAIVAADIHLGLEDKLEHEGISLPRTFLPQIIQSIVQPARVMGASKIILLGDVKHEFGKPEEAEWFSVKKLIKEAFKVVDRIEVVKGNHDNYIASILGEMNIPLHSYSLDISNYTLAHGHLYTMGKKMIIGHEHPAVSIKDDFGLKHRYKAFLHAKIEGNDIYILPSVSPITVGTDMNETNSSEFLSPILNGRDISNAIPYLIEPGSAVKRFPSLRSLG